MIVVSAGMPRAGSAWAFNLTNDLVVAGGGDDVRHVRERYRLHRILEGDNCRVNLHPLRLAVLSVPHLLGHTFVVKTHAPPTSALRRALRTGRVRATYIYRDPRDVVLSSLEEGRRMRDKGVQGSFADLTSFEDAVHFTRSKLPTYERWMDERRALHLRFEDFKADPQAHAARIVAHVGLSDVVSDDQLRAVVGRYAPGNTVRAAHFRTGKSRRFTDVFTSQQINRLNTVFGSHLERMGYT